MSHRMLASAVAAAFAVIAASNASAVTLYDGSLGTSPTAQGLTYASLPFTNFATTAGGVTTLNTMSSQSIYAGYTSAVPLALDRNTGFNVRVDFRLLDGSTSSPDRAGFSLIALSSDKMGIEIGFQNSLVFAQEGGTSPGLFTRAENVAFSAGAAGAPTQFDLTIVGNSYTLKHLGTPILSGPLRDYAAFTGPIDPYETPNFVFIGDDTTSAAASTEFSFVSVAVPEPTLLCGLAMLARLGRRRAARV